MKRLCPALLLCLLAACTNRKPGPDAATPSAADTIALLRQELDSLKRARISAGVDQQLAFSRHDSMQLVRAGLDHPKDFILKDLQQHPELIRLEPVLGGTMYFTGIQLLGRRWVLARVEDGHITGSVLLQYEVAEGPAIRWKTLDAYTD